MSSQFRGAHVIWSAALKPAHSTGKIAGRGATRQVRSLNGFSGSAIQPQSRNVTQVRENDHVFGSAQRQKPAPSSGSAQEGASMADGTGGLTMIEMEALAPAEEHLDEYVRRQPVSADLWREYVDAANAGAFDVGECAHCGSRCSTFRVFCDECEPEGGAR
jgi:hypothetical protein